VKVVPFPQTLRPPLLQVFRRLKQLNESSAASQEHDPTGTVSNNTAAPSTLQNIMFWNIDGAAKHLFIAAVNCVTNFFGLISNLHYRTVVDYFTFSTLDNKI